MKYISRLRAALALAASAGLVAAAANAQTADISIIGKWEIVEAIPAPWSEPQEHAALAAEGKRLLKLVIAFSPTAVESKFKLLNCKRRVDYQPNQLEVDALFQGNLPEPNPTAAAARLGFPKGDIPGVDVQCINAKFTFHFRDPNTALINLDRVIYTLKRR